MQVEFMLNLTCGLFRISEGTGLKFYRKHKNYKVTDLPLLRNEEVL